MGIVHWIGQHIRPQHLLRLDKQLVVVVAVVVAAAVAVVVVVVAGAVEVEFVAEHMLGLHLCHLVESCQQVVIEFHYSRNILLELEFGFVVGNFGY